MNPIPEAVLNVKGETRYIDDLPEPKGLLHAAVCQAPSARGILKGIDPSAALACHPSVRVITAADIPGENQLGSNVPDEPLLIAQADGKGESGEWGFRGQAVALVLADKRSIARKAAALVKLEWENLRPVLDPREAAAKGQIILTPRTQKWGDPAAAFASCATVVAGRVESGGQEHVYLETQTAIAQPVEGGGMRVVSGTQHPSGVQAGIARVLGLPMHLVEVEAPRLGGGFGGKEDQAAGWAALAALGARVTGKPVKLVLSRKDDMRMTGKRHPYSSDFRIGLDAEGNILAFEADYYQNSGAICDLSPAILSRTLFHAAGAYHIPNVRVTGYMCRTNLPAFTAFRGFGAPQAFFVLEAAIDAAVRKTGLDGTELRRKNLLKEGDIFHFGMHAENCRAEMTFDRLLGKSRWSALRAEIDSFNATHRLVKRGAALIPNCFGISFTKLLMNQGGALVHVYHDGSVLVSTGAVEMGQQVSRKIARVVAAAFGIPIERIRVERTSTLTVANTFPTAASTGSDINGMAALAACEEIRKRLLGVASEALGAPADELSISAGRVMRNGSPTPLAWEELVRRTHDSRVDLSAHGFYATPDLVYDDDAERGSPFAYHVYGCAAVTATVDVLRGVYSLDDAWIVHDGGTSLDRPVDLGQIEGALAQGLGWSLLEDLRFDDSGNLLSDSLSTYKVPDLHFMPANVEVEFLEGMPNPKAVMHSKAVGEPPLVYGIAGYFAVLDALRAARQKDDAPGLYDLPLTPEKALDYIEGVRP
jgi:xanthine dehydrogenase large subunit